VRISAQIPPPEISNDLLLNKIDAARAAGRAGGGGELRSRVCAGAFGNLADGHFTAGLRSVFVQAKAKESLAEYTQGAKYRAPGARDLKVVASDYVVLGDFGDADKWFSKVVEWTPQDVQAWYDLGRTKYNENRFEEAISAFKKTLQLDPANVKAEDNLGLSYGALERSDEAIAAYQRAIALQEKSTDKNSGPYLDYGSLLIEDNRVEEALPLLTQAAAISPADFRMHRALGKAYAHLNETAKGAGGARESGKARARGCAGAFYVGAGVSKAGDDGPSQGGE
jgi:tetratricopeptide (TPR) repeat protein